MRRTPANLGSRRQLMRLLGGALGGAALVGRWPRLPSMQRGALRAPSQQALSAEIRIFETTTAHNSFPDVCDMRLDRLYVAEDLELSIEVWFSRELLDEELEDMQWAVSNGITTPSTGDFAGQSNPALITTTLSIGNREATGEAEVSVRYRGVDIALPAPLRVVSNAEYNAAYATLASFTALSARPDSQLPLTVDLLARFLGQESTLVGSPTIGTYQLNICDPRLTHRAGANWGPDTVTDVPLLGYGSDQLASTIIAEGLARELLAQHADAARQFFVDNPREQTYILDYSHSGNLTLNLPLDAALAVHGVQFEGSVSASVDAPAERGLELIARDVAVSGTASDLYDFDFRAVGGGAFPASEAAKVEIASVKHDIGKVFVVSFSVESWFDTLDFR